MITPLWPPSQFGGPKWMTCKAHMHASLSQFRGGESQQWPQGKPQKSARGGAAAPEPAWGHFGLGLAPAYCQGW